MGQPIRFIVRAALAGLASTLLIGAATPTALAPALPGMWEVGRSATGTHARSICIAEPLALSQWEHRGGRCTRVILSDSGNKTLIHYTCADGGFGRSEMTLVTPRSLKITTQGISHAGPFAYTLHARRVGNCPPR